MTIIENYTKPHVKSTMAHVMCQPRGMFSHEDMRQTLFWNQENWFEKESYFSGQSGSYENLFSTLDISPCSLGSGRDFYHNIFDSNERNLNKPDTDAESNVAVDDEKQVPTKENIEVTSKISQNDKLSETLDDLFRKSKPAKTYSIDLATRKDVVNKNIMRIISRYYKGLLAQYFPEFKSTFRKAEALDALLDNFCKWVFPLNYDENLKYVLGAFVIAPKMNILELSPQSKREVAQIHKTLSKYTHKDMERLYSIPSVGVIFANFIEVGMTFFNREELVQKRENVYSEALTYFKRKFKLPNRDLLPLSL